MKAFEYAASNTLVVIIMPHISMKRMVQVSVHLFLRHRTKQPILVMLVTEYRRVAVEVDGPNHFTNSIPHQLLGNTVAKQRCLQARGWAVLSVPFYAWNDLTKSTSQALRMHRQQPQQQQDEEYEPQQQRVACFDARGCPPGDRNEIDSSAGLIRAVEPLDTLLEARAGFLAAELDRAVAVADLPVALQ